MTRIKKSKIKSKITVANERFLMTCPNSACNKTIEPITYFTGELYCPECKKEIAKKLSESIKGADLEQIGAEYYSISQQYFIRYLLEIVPKMRELKENEKEKAAYDVLLKQGQKYLRQAVAYCKRAAYMGNPYALVNLVYYYKSGYDVTVTNREIAAKKLAAVVMGIFADYKEKPEIAAWVREQLSEQIAKAPVLQGGSGLQYLENLINASRDKTRERKPLFGTFSVNCDKLTSDEKKSFVKKLQEAAGLWGSDAKCGLYQYDELNKEWINIESTTDFTTVQGLKHFGYINVKYHTANRRMKRAAKEIINADEDKMFSFFTDIVKDPKMCWPDENRTVGFCDVDIYLCPDENNNREKIDDLQVKLREILGNKN